MTDRPFIFKPRRVAVPFTVVALVMTMTMPKAHASAACDAPWMHPNGSFTLTSTASHTVTQFDVLAFDKKDGEHCTGKVRTTAAMSMGGQAAKSESVMTLQIADGRASVQSENAKGSLHSMSMGGLMSANSTTETSGLLSYVGEITGEGQQLPVTRMDGSASGTLSQAGGAGGQFAAPKMVVSTSVRQVGKQEQLDTVVGKLACWPVSYDKTQSGTVTMMGKTNTINSVTRVVDHFCPSTGLVMRKDMTTNGKQASQVVTALK